MAVSIWVVLVAALVGLVVLGLAIFGIVMYIKNRKRDAVAQDGKIHTTTSVTLPNDNHANGHTSRRGSARFNTLDLKVEDYDDLP